MLDMDGSALLQVDDTAGEYHILSRTLSEIADNKNDFSVRQIEIGSRIVARGQLAVPLGSVRRKQAASLIAGHDIKRSYLLKLAFLRRGRLYHSSNVLPFIPLRQNDLESAIVVLDKQFHASTFVEVRLDQGAEAVAIQSSLPLQGAFAPSHKLAAYWMRGVESHRPANANRAPLDLVHVTPKVQHEFARTLRAIIAIVGQQRRYSHGRDSVLTSNGRFPTALQTELCDQFQIVPDESNNFLSLLFEEISDALVGGARFEGAWGRLELTDTSELSFVLHEPTLIIEPGFIASDDVE